MKICLFILLSLLTGLSSFSQDIWTLQQCLDYAETHNSQLQKIKNTSLISDQNTLQSKGAMLPTITGTATQNYNWGRSIDPFTNIYVNQQVRSNNFSLNGSMVLFNGFLLRNAVQQSKYDNLAAQQDIDQYRLDLSLNIVQGYLSILLNEEKVTNARHQVELTRQVYQRTERLKQSGVVTDGSLLDVYAQMKQEEAAVIQAENDLQLAYLNLGLLLELGDPMSIRITRPENMIVSDSISYQNPQQVMTQAIEQVPQLKSLEYRKQSAAYLYYSSKGRYYPRLTLNGSLSTVYSTSGKVIVGSQQGPDRIIGYTQTGFDTVYSPTYTSITERKGYGPQISDNLNKFVGLTLTVPILNGLQARTTVHRSKLNMTQADLDYSIAKYAMQRTIYSSYYQARGSQAKLNALNESYKATQESYRNAEKRFENGVINSVEFSQIKTRLNQTESDVLLAKYDFIFKNAILDIYAGQPIKIQ